MYVVEGTGKEVKEYEDNIYNHYQLSNGLPDCIKMDDGIKDFDLIYLTGLYGDEQKLAKLLIATNEDCNVITEWDNKYIKPKSCKITDIWNPANGINFDKIAELTKRALQEIDAYENVMAEYEYSQNDDNALLDFIEKNNAKASEILQQIKEFTSKTIQSFKFKDVMEAIKEGRFNIATGEMKPKIKP
jgi:hypothetical protein